MKTEAEPGNGFVDAESRLNARVRLDRNVIVEAGAGTGKTTLLTDRLLFCVLGAGVPVTEIVALTFTEKAAAEIRWRLGERLIELRDYWRGAGAPESCERFTAELYSHFRVDESTAAQRARAALEDMDKAMIGTLHHFATWLLRAYPLEAAVSPSFQVDEGERFLADLFSSEWSQWLDGELGENAPREKEWMEALDRASLESLEALARELCHPRADLDRLRGTILGLGGPASGLGALHPEIERWLRETLDLIPSELARQPPARGRMEERLKEVASRIGAFLDSGDGSRGTARLPAAQWPKGWDDRHRTRLEMAGRIAEAASPETDELLLNAARLVLPFVERFRALYAWRGWITFDGILWSARNLVRDHPEVRAEIKRRFRTFLIDEFQDTDPLQGELLMYLAEKPGRAAARWQDAALEPGRLFVVGDPKQSIYRFRGADLAAYERFLRHIRAQEPAAILCDLKTNFRSHERLIAPVNAAFEKIMVYASGSQPEYKPIHPRRAGPENGVELVVVSEAEQRRPDVGSVRRAEARWIADWIQVRCGSNRQYRFKDVALLLRSTSPLAVYLEEFRARDIPYVVEAEKYFYGTQEVVDFLNLLKALADPGDAAALAGLLRSPLAGLTDPEILALREAGALRYSKDPPESVPGGARARTFFGVLRDLRRSVGRRPLAELVQDILNRTHLLELLPAAYHGQQTLSNLLKFARMGTEAADAEGATLRSFIRRVSDSIAEAREEGESPLADEHLDAVRILTVHKAKGLEYPVVMIPNLSGTTQGGRSERSVWMDWEHAMMGLRLSEIGPGLSYAFLNFIEKAREQDELVRLLYVAMTRAKERLILIGAKRPAPRSLASLLERAGLWPHSEDASVRIHEIVAEKSSRRPPRAARASSAVAAPDFDALAKRWKRRVARRDEWLSTPPITSPTALAREAEKPFFRLDPESMPAAAASWVGRACHRVLQYWDFSSSAASIEEALSSACRSLEHQAGGAAVPWESVRAESGDILRNFLGSPAARELGEAQILGREIPFVFARGTGRDNASGTARAEHNLARGKTVLHGSIDLVYRRRGRIVVADFKTDRVEKGCLEERAESYRKQGDIYLEAVRRVLGEEVRVFSVVFLRAGRSVELRP